MGNYKCKDERFSDIQMLRYRLDGFEELPLSDKKLIYFLSKATLWGRDITFDQFGKYNLKIRKLLEAIYISYGGNRDCDEFNALVVYLKRIWFSNGIYHHYGCEKFVPEFSEQFFHSVMMRSDVSLMPLNAGENVDDLFDSLREIIFNPSYLPKRVNLDTETDVVKSSACNFYDGLSQCEVEEFYRKMQFAKDEEPVSYGLNSTLRKNDDGNIIESVWRENGMYGNAIKHIVFWLKKAASVTVSESQKKYIDNLINFYRTGDLRIFNEYCINWVKENNTNVDFVNGFIEVYGDPLGLKGTWEGIVEYKDVDATRRTSLISSNAQWFEDHSPVDSRFKKDRVKGVVAHVVRAAMLGGDEYPSTAIGINLPNADWIRAKYGSKSVTISNLIAAYNEAAHGNGFKEEFIQDSDMISLIEKYGDACDDLHTDLHECLGHGSGKLIEGVSPDALKTYGSTIEEARADLFGLYYIADKKIVELGLLDNCDAYKASYYSYILNGLMTQLVRITIGNNIEEAHMRNRSLIAHWCYEKGKKDKVIEFYRDNGNTYIRINDYHKLRWLFSELLAEIQRIKSEGDYDAARKIVEDYAVKIDIDLHKEVHERYSKLKLAPYKGFINPVLSPVLDSDGNIKDIAFDYTEPYDKQMLRYSNDYASLI